MKLIEGSRRSLSAVLLGVMLLGVLAEEAHAQAQTGFVVTPQFPEEGESVSIFLRTSDSSGALVACYPGAHQIIGVSISGNSIVLDGHAALPPGGATMEANCDGNPVVLGPLPRGVYSVARRLISGPVISPLFPIGAFVVGPSEIPALGPLALVLLAGSMLVVARRRRGETPRA